MYIPARGKSHLQTCIPIYIPIHIYIYTHTYIPVTRTAVSPNQDLNLSRNPSTTSHAMQRDTPQSVTCMDAVSFVRVLM